MRISSPWLMIGLVLAGCSPQYTWEHPGFDSADAVRQGEIDSAECTAIAMRTIPQASNLSTMNAGYFDWSAFDQNLTNNTRYNAEVRNLVNACLMPRGWERVSAEQQSTTPIPTASSPSEFGVLDTAEMTRGVAVIALRAGDVADRSGIAAGDIIVTYDGAPINSARDLQVAVDSTMPGDTKSIEILRNGRDINVAATF
jgi:hypothetical protein